LNGVSVWPQIYAHGIYFTCSDMRNANKSLDLRVNAFMDENRNLKSQRSALEKDKTTFHAHFYCICEALTHTQRKQRLHRQRQFMSLFELNNHKGSG
jgi:hypothetical protein